MNIIFYIIPLAVALGAFFIILFIWATKSGQYDDMDTPAYKILIEDQTSNNKNIKGKEK